MHDAQEISLHNDLLRKLIRELVDCEGMQSMDKKTPLNIYANDKESYFQTHYMTLCNQERMVLHRKRRVM